MESEAAAAATQVCASYETAPLVLHCAALLSEPERLARTFKVGPLEEGANEEAAKGPPVEEPIGALVEARRLERSNSCSQAELETSGGCVATLLAAADSASSLKASNLHNSSVSHEDLTQSFAAGACLAASPEGATLLAQGASVSSDQLFQANSGLAQEAQQEAYQAGVAGDETSSCSQTSEPSERESASQRESSKELKQQQAAHSSSSSKFFSSKLNTGSLWSLLSVGSSTSVAQAELSAGAENVESGSQKSASCSAQRKENQSSSMETNNKQQDNKNAAASFFSRVQFKRPQQAAVSQSQERPNASKSAEESANNRLDLEQSLDRKRFRFSLKYIGSAILHRNFTLPMLEWIARDIKRQTKRGAQNVNQRQFTIPARDILFEIQSNQLTANSCKDGHCIFVHPMHCVSKYAQLQHDNTCFAYLIRDTKDSPNFCHVFQAKSANKVHDIFKAVREATTQSQALQQASQQTSPALTSNGEPSLLAQGEQPATGSAFGAWSARVQKSASSDGSQFKSLLFKAAGSGEQATVAPSKQPSASNSQPTQRVSPALTKALVQPASSNASNCLQQQEAASSSDANVQFENSYQFEVMFVKKVKLQCRRVPASFVDDALETLKSFEVLKGGESKGSQMKGLGKRIINASVDERQEYDEVCHSPPPQQQQQQQPPPSTSSQSRLTLTGGVQRQAAAMGDSRNSLNEQRLEPNAEESRDEAASESRSCQQSPAKSAQSNEECSSSSQTQAINSSKELAAGSMKKHQSMDCLENIGRTIRSAKHGNAPTYTNDFSPYNTITSSDLNERIAAIPVVSSSVSLDHEMRQKLARQVRETIMATAASIKKDVYASGDKLDSSSSSKALDSLSCTVTSSVASADDDQDRNSPIFLTEDQQATARHRQALGLHFEEAHRSGPQAAFRPHYAMESGAHAPSLWSATGASNADSAQRRSSAGPAVSQQQAANNFDLFRRGSARQVVKNRTMLLLIGKDELCTISIDKHQMLFSKSFSSVVHCLQGNNNKDHFGLICRDSGKINPQTESYAGFVFKCQSEKVVREIMGALKQVIYSSQHNYHGYNSPYNPLNTVQYKTGALQKPAQKIVGCQQAQNAAQNQPQVSLATKRGFLSSIGVDEAARLNRATLLAQQQAAPASSEQAPSGGATAPLGGRSTNSAACATHQFSIASSSSSSSSSSSKTCQQLGAGLTSSAASSAAAGNSLPKQQPKNLIKSMFCDNCPLYWFHRLCCDIESLSAEASKAIILRRIDSSLSEKEQDELYSRFSDFNIESVDEHNEIFMSLLRHLCERKQLKHNQTSAHMAAMAKQFSLKSGSAFGSADGKSSNAQAGSASLPRQSSLLAQSGDTFKSSLAPSFISAGGQHQRSGSSGGSSASSLAQVIGQQASAANQAGQSLADASSVAFDNLKRAKNSISFSIENMLKRRLSVKDEQQTSDEEGRLREQNVLNSKQPMRSGSFKTSSREGRTRDELQLQQEADSEGGGGGLSLKRSQSTSDYSQQQAHSTMLSWKDSLSRTLNEDLTTPLVGLFRRRSSTFGSRANELNEEEGDQRNSTTRTSTECLSQYEGSPHKHPSSPNASESRFNYAAGGGSSPSSMLSSVFWKKSIFDKIRQPLVSAQEERNLANRTQVVNSSGDVSLLGDQTNNQSIAEQRNNQQVEALTEPNVHSITVPQTPVVAKKRTSEELRYLWRKAIVEQITLLKMEKQNQRLLANNVECDIQRVKLNYRDVLYSREVLAHWAKLLHQDPTKKVEFSEVARLIKMGVPKQRRGEIWMFLMNQYQLRHGTSFQPADSEYRGDANQNYRSLLSQLSVQQHEIFVDIGRTFPTHPYYSQYLSIGQLSLFNLLKAYSLLDPEVGYCQGLSFVAGILLLHVDSEDEAFELMRHLLFNFGLRKQYLPSMNALHLQLYQMTRLLRDHEYDLFHHFDHYDMSPSLYAAPWFLTLFASQFPLGFVSRLLDLIFLMGIEAIFRVSLNLLAYHRASILTCGSLEATMQFMRGNLVNIDDKNLVRIFDKSMSLDLRNKLIEYEIEYTFYCAEDRAKHLPRHSASQQNTQTRSLNKELSHEASNSASMESKSDTETSDKNAESTSVVADATATIIIQHLLANNHLKSLRSNYSY